MFCNNKEDGESNFFETYQPTFMNPEFFVTPEFPDFGFENQCTTQIFSFLSTNTGGYASTTVFQNAKASTSTTADMFQNLTSMFGQEGTNQYFAGQSSVNNSENRKYDPLYTPNPQGASYILIENEPISSNTSTNCSENTRFFNFEDADREFGTQQQKLSSPSKKINKLKDGLNMRLMNKKPSKKNRS